MRPDRQVGNLAVGDHPPDCLDADVEEVREFLGCEGSAAVALLVDAGAGWRPRAPGAGAHDDHARRGLVIGTRVLGWRFG